MRKILSLVLCMSIIFSVLSTTSANATEDILKQIEPLKTEAFVNYENEIVKKEIVVDEVGNYKSIEFSEKSVDEVKGAISISSTDGDVFYDNANNIYLEVKKDYFLNGKKVVITSEVSVDEMIKDYGIQEALSIAISEYFEINKENETTIIVPTGLSSDEVAQRIDGAKSTLIGTNYYVGYHNYDYMCQYWDKGTSESGWHNFAVGSNPRSYLYNAISAIGGIITTAAIDKVTKGLGTVASVLYLEADQVTTTGTYSHMIYLKESVVEKWCFIKWNNSYQLGYKGQSANVTWSHLYYAGLDQIGNHSGAMKTLQTDYYSYPDVKTYNFFSLGGYYEYFDYQQFKNEGTEDTYNYDSLGD